MSSIFAFIKNDKCVNLAIFESQEYVDEMHELYIGDNDYIIPCEDGFGVGDIYIDGVWSKGESIIEPEPQNATLEELSEALDILLGGRDDELDNIISSYGA